MRERGWMIALRENQYASIMAASRACKTSPTLLRIIEEGSVTLPEIADRIGKGYGMSAEQIDEITCQATVERRALIEKMHTKELRDRRIEGCYL